MGRYTKRRLVFVSPFNSSAIKYGFATSIDQSQGTQLGHTPVGDDSLQGYVFGANSPKPARASKAFASGTVSSFVNAATIAAARTAGWRIGKALLRRGSSTSKTVVAYVTLEGVQYAWNLPKETQSKIGGDLATLGIKLASGPETDLVFGASKPRPPTASKVIGSGSAINVISTFYDPSRNLPPGWRSGTSRIDPTRNP